MTGEQLGFGFDEMAEEARVAHLPSSGDEATAYYRGLIDKHHAAMMSGDVDSVMALREEARDLAIKMNGGKMLGINGGEGSPVDQLEKATDAPEGTIPLWGQRGNFIVQVGDTPVRIELDGMFGIGASSMYWLPFATHAVDKDKPFFSETGYRSFLGIHADPVAGLAPDEFCRRVIEAHIAKDCKGKLRNWTDWVERRRQAQQNERACP